VGFGRDFLSLWPWPYAGIRKVIPHPDHRNVYWIIAGTDVLQVRYQPEDAPEHHVF
jgi:hypothetical protein